MDKQYKNLMQQQTVDEKVTADFYEKLEKRNTRHRHFGWKAAIAVACVALLLPITAFAVRNIVCKPKIKIGKIACLSDMYGYSITFDNVENHSLQAFPEDVQAITEHKYAYLNTLEEAEKELNIDLLNNTVLEDASTTKGRIWYEDGHSSHCIINYATLDNQLYYIGVKAQFYRQNVPFYLRAKITVEHPKLTEEDKNVLHGLTCGLNDYVEINYEEYTTKKGIPVAVVTTKRDDIIDYYAIFSVNNISYEICFPLCREMEEQIKTLLLEVLDGFVLN